MDVVVPELVGRVLGQGFARASRIHGATTTTRQPLDDVPDDLLLLTGRNLVHLDDEHHTPAQVRLDLAHTEHREVTMTREVLGENALQFRVDQSQGWLDLAPDPVLHKRPALGFALAHEVIVERQPNHRPLFAHGVFNPDARQADAAAVARDGIELLAHGGLAHTIGVADLAVPLPLAFGRGRCALHEAHAFVQAVGDCIVERDRDHGRICTIAPGLDVAAQLSERVVLAVVGTDDRDLAAPDQERGGRLQHALHIRVEGCLVDNDVALQAADVRRSARQGAHLKAAGEPNAIRGDVLGLATFVLVFEEELLDARDAFALGTRDHPGELGAVADRLQALSLVSPM